MRQQKTQAYPTRGTTPVNVGRSGRSQLSNYNRAAQDRDLTFTGLEEKTKEKVILSRNQSQPQVKSRIIEESSPGRAYKAKVQQMKQSVDQVRAYSELIRQSYKPKISKKKIKELELQKAKINANKPGYRERDLSPSFAKDKIKGAYNDPFANVRGGSLSRSTEYIEEFGLRQQRERLLKQNNGQNISLDSLKIQDPMQKYHAAAGNRGLFPPKNQANNYQSQQFIAPGQATHDGYMRSIP